MPITSAFTPPGHFAFSSRPSHGESIYRTLCDNFGNVFDVSDSSIQQARLYAQAMCLASAQYQLDRAGNNRLPATATELLGLLENDYQVIPPPTATLDQRRAFLAAVQRISRGNRYEAIYGALLMLLGPALIAYTTTLPANIVAIPASVGFFGSPGSVGVFADRSAKKKAFSIDVPVSTVGTPIAVPITLLGGTESPLIGETFCIDPDPRRNIEQIVITAASYGTITATFAKAHDSETIAVRPHPYWTSNQRMSTVFVTQAAAQDVETRRKINELMARALRGVSTWQIAQQDHTGFFTSDDAVLGLPDINIVE